MGIGFRLVVVNEELRTISMHLHERELTVGIFTMQPEIYAEVRGRKLVTAVMPPPFQRCSREGTLTGCLFKSDHPDDQCKGNRTGDLGGCTYTLSDRIQ